MDPGDLATLMRDRSVLVLSDMTLPPTAPPLAAAAFRLDRSAGTAQLAGIGVRAQLRGRGLGCRLLTGALMWLRADGFEQVHAFAAGDGAGASLLASAGFTAAVGQDADRAGGRRRLMLLL
jgi:GNAT superfamily N-acetyltransferase